MTTTPALRAYQNCTHTKAQAVAMMQEHRRLDHLIQGTHTEGEGETRKGGLVGCATGSDHTLFESAFAIPCALALLAEDIFERLPTAESKNFAVDFFEHINEGADLSNVYDQWCAWMLGDPVDGLATIFNEGAEKEMAVLFTRAAGGDEPSKAEWQNTGAAEKSAHKLLTLVSDTRVQGAGD